MGAERDDRNLQLVFSRDRNRIDWTRLLFEEAGTQGSLFLSPKSGVVVFVQIASVEGDQFAEILRLAQPSFVFDLRLAPRFDVGNLNRRKAFDLFDEVNATYIDATMPLMRGEERESAIQQFREAIAKTDLRRPLFFLIASERGSIISDREVLGILASAGKPAAELFMVPA